MTQGSYRTLAGALLLGAFFCAPMTSASAADSQPACKVPTDLIKLDRTLARTAQHLLAREPLTVVAIGSSSTFGAGATSPASAYPNRLAVELSTMFPGEKITVINRGINGQEASEMLARFKTDVLDEKPDLVLWQLGTNSALRGTPIDQIATLVDTGIEQLKKEGVDVVLIDPQFVPRVIAAPEADDMVKLISARAAEHRVSVFHRFAIMRHWRETAGLGFDAFTSPDNLHMNDWGYDCWAKLLASAIADVVSRPAASANVLPARTPTP